MPPPPEETEVIWRVEDYLRLSTVCISESLCCGLLKWSDYDRDKNKSDKLIV